MITTEFKRVCELPSDINEHLPVLRDLAKECKHVTEMGVRGIVSTWAFLEGLKGGGTLVSIDNTLPAYYGGDLELVEKLAKEENVNFTFILDDTLTMNIEETDILFIDTIHEYEQLVVELNRHSNKVRKYIVLHDTVSCREELMPVIREFVAIRYGSWQIKQEYFTNNGLLILERI